MVAVERCPITSTCGPASRRHFKHASQRIHKPPCRSLAAQSLSIDNEEIERDIGISAAGLSAELGTHFVRPVVGNDGFGMALANGGQRTDGVVVLELKRPSAVEAATCLQAVQRGRLARQPRYTRAHFGRALVRLDRGDYPGAIRALETLLRLDRDKCYELLSTASRRFLEKEAAIQEVSRLLGKKHVRGELKAHLKLRKSARILAQRQPCKCVMPP